MHSYQLWSQVKLGAGLWCRGSREKFGRHALDRKIEAFGVDTLTQAIMLHIQPPRPYPHFQPPTTFALLTFH